MMDVLDPRFIDALAEAVDNQSPRYRPQFDLEWAIEAWLTCGYVDGLVANHWDRTDDQLVGSARWWLRVNLIYMWMVHCRPPQRIVTTCQLDLFAAPDPEPAQGRGRFSSRRPA